MAGASSTKSRLSPEFGKWLRSTRESMRLTVKDFAERAGMTAGTITNFEKGHRSEGVFSVDVFRQLAEALNMDLGYVLYKAGYDLGPDGINLAALKRVEAVADDFAEYASDLRIALADAIGEFDKPGNGDDGMIIELARGLAALDRLSERLRREGFTPGSTSSRVTEASARTWSDAEEAFLRTNPNLTHAEAADHLGRTVDAVRAHRIRLNGGGR
jgi:transcriptional regulator with XRE-family HTH domain